MARLLRGTGKLALQWGGELTAAQRSGGTAEPVRAAARVYGGCGGEDGVQGGRRGHLKGPGHLGRACPVWNLAEICGRGSRPGVAGGGGQTWRAGPGWQRAGGTGVWGRAAAGRRGRWRSGRVTPTGGPGASVGAATSAWEKLALGCCERGPVAGAGRVLRWLLRERERGADRAA